MEHWKWQAKVGDFSVYSRGQVLSGAGINEGTLFMPGKHTSRDKLGGGGGGGGGGLVGVTREIHHCPVYMVFSVSAHTDEFLQPYS